VTPSNSKSVGGVETVNHADFSFAPLSMFAVQKKTSDLVQWLRAIPLEAVFWAGALAFAASIDPQASGGLNLCLIEHLGLPCPGDGLGTGIAHLVRGNWDASWAAHPLAGPVVGVLVVHIVTVCRSSLRASR